MKALVGDGDDRILGFTMIGAAASEVMAAVHTAMLAGSSSAFAAVYESARRQYPAG